MTDALPVLDELALATAHLPGPGAGHRGGPWYDVVAIGGGGVAMALGDAGDTAEADRLRRAVAGLDPARRSAATMLACLDRATRGGPASAPSTALCVTLGPHGALCWSAAGHTPPLVAGPDGARYLDGGQGRPLGRRGRPAQATESLPPGTTVALCTGAPPTSRDPVAGVADPLMTVVAKKHGLAPAALAQVLTARLDRGSPERPARMLLVRVLPGPLVQRLPADPRRLATVRRAVAGWSAQAGLSEDAAADLQLLLSEAATNAVEHAYRDTEPGELLYSVRYHGADGIRVHVQDFGRWRPPPADSGYRGRGLAVIHNLADEVSLAPSDHGTRITFTVPSDLPPLAERPLTGITDGWRPRPRPGDGAAR